MDLLAQQSATKGTVNHWAIHLVHVLALTRLASTLGFIALHISSFLPAPPFLGQLGFWSPPPGHTMHLHTRDLSTDS